VGDLAAISGLAAPGRWVMGSAEWWERYQFKRYVEGSFRTVLGVGAALGRIAGLAVGYYLVHLAGGI
jgi:hypothetical protein